MDFHPSWHHILNRVTEGTAAKPPTGGRTVWAKAHPQVEAMASTVEMAAADGRMRELGV